MKAFVYLFDGKEDTYAHEKPILLEPVTIEFDGYTKKYKFAFEVCKKIDEGSDADEAEHKR